MKIIVNQDKGLRLVGYDEKTGFNPLTAEIYISKNLKPDVPVYCVIDNHFKLLLHKLGENDNYSIYKPFDLVNIKYDSSNKKVFISFDERKTEEVILYLPALEDTSLLEYLKGGA